MLPYAPRTNAVAIEPADKGVDGLLKSDSKLTFFFQKTLTGKMDIRELLLQFVLSTSILDE